MTTYDTFAPARAAPAASAISAILGRIATWNDRRVTVKLLNRLSDRELADIGLRRAEIAAWAARN